MTPIEFGWNTDGLRQGKLKQCQGIVREMSGNFNWSGPWQPCWRVSLGERICTSSSTTPASCRYSHWHPPYVTITHSMRGSRRDTLIFIGGKSQHETTVETNTEKWYWHWHISQSQSWTRLWIRIAKCTYIQKRFSCTICIVSTTQWRLGLHFHTVPWRRCAPNFPTCWSDVTCSQWNYHVRHRTVRVVMFKTRSTDLQTCVCVVCKVTTYFIGTIDTDYLHGIAI